MDSNPSTRMVAVTRAAKARRRRAERKRSIARAKAAKAVRRNLRKRKVVQWGGWQILKKRPAAAQPQAQVPVIKRRFTIKKPPHRRLKWKQPWPVPVPAVPGPETPHQDDEDDATESDKIDHGADEAEAAELSEHVGSVSPESDRGRLSAASTLAYSSVPICPSSSSSRRLHGPESEGDTHSEEFSDIKSYVNPASPTPSPIRFAARQAQAPYVMMIYHDVR